MGTAYYLCTGIAGSSGTNATFNPMMAFVQLLSEWAINKSENSTFDGATPWKFLWINLIFPFFGAYMAYVFAEKGLVKIMNKAAPKK
jgi:glycerol uptake facilitator-like aquaporin